MKKYIVILHYKTIEKTRECVASVLQTSPSCNILIVDNFSANGSLEKLHEEYNSNESVEFLEISENIGFARANNVAMKKLLSDNIRYVILTNNDVVFLKNAIDNMFSCLRERDDAIVVAPKVINPLGDIQNTVQRKRNKASTYMFRKIIARDNGNFAESCSTTCEVAQFSGCCFACNLTNMEKVNFFDENTFLYFEESILSEKAFQKELKLLYMPTAKVLHYHGVSTKSINYMVFYYMLFSEIYYLIKYLKVNKYLLLIYCMLKRKEHKRKYADISLYKKETEIIKSIKKYRYEKS